MKKGFSLTFLLAFVFNVFSAFSQAPSVEKFKEVFNAQLQKLRPDGYSRRTVKFIQVTPGSPNSGYYPFKVTAYVHDYGPGYPSNRYYGQTCLGKMDGWKFDMRKDAFGEWIVQGRFTVTDNQCKDNPSEGAESIPLSSVPGTTYNKSFTNSNATTPYPKQPIKTASSQLYLGEYACYGVGSRLMAGMGFILLPGGRYYDVDKQRGGTYRYDPAKATITFSGGFLSGQVGRNVTLSGFQISNTVSAEPWR